jgi:hypothetical protein
MTLDSVRSHSWMLGASHILLSIVNKQCDATICNTDYQQAQKGHCRLTEKENTQECYIRDDIRQYEVTFLNDIFWWEPVTFFQCLWQNSVTQLFRIQATYKHRKDIVGSQQKPSRKNVTLEMTLDSMRSHSWMTSFGGSQSHSSSACDKTVWRNYSEYRLHTSTERTL